MPRGSRMPVVIIVLSLLPSSCGGGGPGPRTWFDRPLEMDNPVPVQVMTLQAHASDADGMATIEFFVDGEPYREVSVGGGRLGSAIVEWMPPGPGTYEISAMGTDNAGNSGAPARVTVVVSGEAELAALEAPSPTPSEEALPATEEQVPEEEEEAPADAPTANPRQDSNCRAGTTTSFEIEAILLQGETAPIIGKTSSLTHFLILAPKNKRQCWIAANLVDVEGDVDGVPVVRPPSLPVAEQPPEEPPAEEPPEEEPPPPPPPPTPDITPPFIVTITLSPSKITVESSGCESKPRTSTSTLTIYEEGGIDHVSANWSTPSESGTVVYSTSDGTTYVGEFGPVSNHGTMSINGSVIDTSDNSTPFVHTLTVEPCIE